jgi:hypothetical protein
MYKFAIDSFADYRTEINDKGEKTLPRKDNKWHINPDRMETLWGNLSYYIVELVESKNPILSTVATAVDNAIKAEKIDYYDVFYRYWYQQAIDLIAINYAEKIRQQYLTEHGVSGKNYKRSEEAYDNAMIDFLTNCTKRSFTFK